MLIRADHIPVEAALRELMEVCAECRETDWDGYEALPVSDATAQQARRVLESLPREIPTPSFGAEPHGSLTMEWHDSPRRSVSVSVDDQGKLYYAALIDEESVQGTLQFSGHFPAVLVDLIRRVLIEPNGKT